MIETELSNKLHVLDQESMRVCVPLQVMLGTGREKMY